VTNDSDRKRRSFGTHRCDETLQVVQQVFEATHVAAGAAGAAVTPLVVGVDLKAGAGKIGRRVFVAPAVFPVAVNENDDSL
jgi:hypothetical protein